MTMRVVREVPAVERPELFALCPRWKCRKLLEWRGFYWRCPTCGVLLPLRFWDPNAWPEPEEG